MDKPENPYKKGSRSWKLFDGDWEGCTLQEIAREVGSSPELVHWNIRAIKSKTGYEILYTKLPGDCSRKKTKWDSIHKRFLKNKISGSCETCCNIDCSMLQKRKAIAWRNCSGYIPEEVATD